MAGMDDDLIGSSQTLDEYSQLDLNSWPPMYLSSTHLTTDDLDKLEDELTNAGASVTYNINEAEIILSKVVQKKRIQFDLRAKGLWTKELQQDEVVPEHDPPKTAIAKKRKHDQVENADQHEDSSTASEDEMELQEAPVKPLRKVIRPNQSAKRTPSPNPSCGRVIRVVKNNWFTDSIESNKIQSLDDYTTYRGRCVDRATAVETPKHKGLVVRGSGKLTATSQLVTESKPAKLSPAREILQRAQEDASESAPKAYDRFGKRKFVLNTPSANPSTWEAGHGTDIQYAHLLQQTTTEYEGGSSSDIPEPPEWVKAHVKYACQRLTPKDNPNDPFIELLKKIKLARLLTNDEIGVRAYSTSIASLAAYTYKISHPKEILILPGCEAKIANLFVEWTNTGKIKAVDDLEADEDLKVLKLLYNIWGVGATTAREFYYDRGWRQLDDIIEYGWKDLSRVQQIGVKYYDEFLDLIPRAEVESIGAAIHRHAVKVRNAGIQTMLVGGYRRGKEASGDVDIIVSHPDEEATMDLINDLVTSLEAEEWITHTLTLSSNNSKRDQVTLPFRAGGGGHGFDTLDKALVVWQNPSWPTKARDLAEKPDVKNPNPNIHRRVDIIVSPWRTVGCAVVGWSGGTTFERDLRRYAKSDKSWKFDSSGVRDRRNGEVVDIEGFFEYKGQLAPGCRAKTLEEAERRVFEGFGLMYRAPWERCTG